MTKRATKKDAYPDTSDLAFPIKYCRHIRLVSVNSDLRSKTLILVHMRCAPYRAASAIVEFVGKRKGKGKKLLPLEIAQVPLRGREVLQSTSEVHAMLLPAPAPPRATRRRPSPGGYGTSTREPAFAYRMPPAYAA